MRISFHFFVTAIVSLSGCGESNVDISFLTGVPRFNNLLNLDYYFSCSTEGLTLQWEVNGQSLGGFSPGQIVDTLSGSRSPFSYTATLLSSQPTSGSRHTFDSVLIVSLMNDSSILNVTCYNGISSSTTQSGNIGAVKNSKFMDTVFLEFVLVFPIVGSHNYNTNIFICGIDNAYMIWQAQEQNFVRVLTIDDSIGQDKHNLNENDTFVRKQAIFIDNDPFQIVTVIFLTDTSDVVATCGYMTHFLQLSSTIVPIDMGTTSDADLPTFSTDTSHSSTEVVSTTEIMQMESTSSFIYIMIPVVILGAAAIVILVIIICKLKRGTKKSTGEGVEYPQNLDPTQVVDLCGQKRSDVLPYQHTMNILRSDCAKSSTTPKVNLRCMNKNPTSSTFIMLEIVPNSTIKKSFSGSYFLLKEVPLDESHGEPTQEVENNYVELDKKYIWLDETDEHLKISVCGNAKHKPLYMNLTSFAH